MKIKIMELIDFLNANDNYSELLEQILLEAYYQQNELKNVDVIEKKIIDAINVRLNKAATRNQGFQFLMRFLSIVPKEGLMKNFSYWLNSAIQFLSKVQSNSRDIITVCKAIGSLFENCKQIPELEKQVSLNNIKHLTNILAEQHYQDKSGSNLQLTSLILYYFPESCAHHQTFFNKIVSFCVDQEQKNLVHLGARCYVLLVRAKERLFIKTAYKNNSIDLPENKIAACYLFHQKNLCNELYSIIVQLFQDFVNDDLEQMQEFQILNDIDILQLPIICFQDVVKYYTGTERRFLNLCIYLSAFLKAGGRNGKNYVSPRVILKVICQGLSITSNNLQKNDDYKVQFLILILPKIHTGLLNVLEALIYSFQKELIPYTNIILHIILQSLEWSKNTSKKPYLAVRCLTYKILSIWIESTGSMSGFQLFTNEIFPHIKLDISDLDKNISAINLKSHKISHLNTACEKKFLNGNENINSFVDNSYSFIDNLDIIKQALLSLQSITSKNSYYLKQSFYEDVCNMILTSLNQFYNKKDFLYAGSSWIEVRLLLLSILRSLQTNPNFSLSTPIQYVIQVFGTALAKECNLKIINEARLGLTEARLLVYPTSPTLNLHQQTKSFMSISQLKSLSPIKQVYCHSRSLTNQITNESQKFKSMAESLLDSSQPQNISNNFENQEIQSTKRLKNNIFNKENKKTKFEEKLNGIIPTPQKLIKSDSSSFSTKEICKVADIDELENEEIIFSFCDLLQDSPSESDKMSN